MRTLLFIVACLVLAILLTTSIAYATGPTTSKNLLVQVLSHDGSEEDAQVFVYSVGGKLEAQGTVNKYNIAVLPPLDAGEYNLDVYYTPPDSLGLTEFWGSQSFTISGMPAIVSFDRELPYFIGRPIDRGIMMLGDSSDISLREVESYKQGPLQVRAHIYIDRDKQPPYDYCVETGNMTLQQWADFSAGSFTPRDVGNYDTAVALEAYYGGRWVVTDQWGWFHLFTVEPLHGYLLVEVREAGGGISNTGQVELNLLDNQNETLTDKVRPFGLGAGTPAAVFELPPGEYQVVASYVPEKNLAFADGPPLKVSAKPTTITIERDRKTNLTIREAALLVHVKNGNGQPVANAAVSLSLEDQQGHTWPLKNSEIHTDVYGDAWYLHLTPNNEQWKDYIVDVSWKSYTLLFQVNRGGSTAVKEISIADPAQQSEWNNLTLNLPSAPAWPGSWQIILLSVCLIVSPPICWYGLRVRRRKMIFGIRLPTTLAYLLCTGAIMLSIFAAAVSIIVPLNLGGTAALSGWVPFHLAAILCGFATAILAVSLFRGLKTQQAGTLEDPESSVLLSTFKVFLILTCALDILWGMGIGPGFFIWGKAANSGFRFITLTFYLLLIPVVWWLYSYLNLNRIFLKSYRAVPLQPENSADQRLLISVRELATRLGLGLLPSIYRSSRVASPRVFGRNQNIMVVPSNFEDAIAKTEADLGLEQSVLFKFIVLHELAHFKHRDNALVSWGAVFARGLIWWGPFALAVLLFVFLLYRTAPWTTTGASFGVSYSFSTLAWLLPGNATFNVTYLLGLLSAIVFVPPFLIYIAYRRLYRYREFSADAAALSCLDTKERSFLTGGKWDERSFFWLEALSYWFRFRPEPGTLSWISPKSLMNRLATWLSSLSSAIPGVGSLLGGIWHWLAHTLDVHPSTSERIKALARIGETQGRQTERVVTGVRRGTAIMTGVACCILPLCTLWLISGAMIMSKPLLPALVLPNDITEALAFRETSPLVTAGLAFALFILPICLYVLLFGQPLKARSPFSYRRYLGNWLKADLVFLSVWTCGVLPALLLRWLPDGWPLRYWMICAGTTCALGAILPFLMPATRTVIIDKLRETLHDNARRKRPGR